MKFIIINRKRLGVTAIMLGLMVVLFGFGKNFDERLKQASLIYNDINSLIKYEGLNKTFSYKLPEEWSASEENLSDNEVVYSNRFVSKDQTIRGLMQVWNYKGDLKTFLERSKDAAFKPQSTKYKDYTLTEIQLNNKKVYLLNYTVDTGSKKYYKGYEYFIPGTGRFFRFSFFVSEDNFRETMPNIFETIVKTLEHTD